MGLLLLVAALLYGDATSDSWQGGLRLGESQVIDFSLQENDHVRGELHSSQGPALLTLFGPTGEQIGQWRYLERGNHAVAFAAASSGGYRLKVEAGSEVLVYYLFLEVIRPAR